MKQILIFILTLIPLLVFSQTGPGGVGNSTSNEIWLPVEVNCYTDAGTTLGVNNSNIQQWNDISGNANNAIQTDNSFKPNLNINALNGFSTLTFDGSNDRILSTGVTSNSQATIFVVVQFNNFTNTNDGIFQGSPAGNAFSTLEKSIGMWINTSNGRIWGRGRQTNNTNRNISQTTALSTGQFYIITQDYNGTSIDKYVDGTAAGTVTYNNTLNSWSDFGIGRQGTETLDGDLSELIVHRVSLNSAARIISENYLASKYGLTLSNNDLYDEDNVGNGNYDFEVAGIGRVDASNIHSDAQGTGIVRILNPTGLGNDEFLIWGHDNGVQQATETTDIPAGIQARFERVWRASEVNSSGTAVDVGNIDVRFDLTGLGSVTASDLRLLIDTDNDGVFNDEPPISGATSLGSNIYEFTGVTGIANNLRFTLATINTSQTPLPIELVYFGAISLDDESVKLNWQTSSEINNDYFTIERSANGIDWEEVNTIKGAGNSSTLLSYSTVDSNPFQGTSYYRLKQTDFDGQFEYSQVESINIQSLENSQIEIFPNPATNQITIKGSSYGLKNIVLYNTLGQNITSLTEQAITNENQVVIDISKLSKGMYYIKTKTTSNKVYKQ